MCITKKEAEFQAQYSTAIFNRIITSDLLLKDGTSTQMVTCLPVGMNFEEIIYGLNNGLLNTHDVISVQHTVSRVTENKGLKPCLKFDPSFFPVR